MSDTAQGAGAPASRPMPRPPGAAVPRRPRPPRERGTDLEPDRSPAQLRRRKFTWLSFSAVLAAIGVATVRFFFPRALFEPPTTFSVGYPSDYGFGVDSRWQSKFRVWVCRDAEKVYVINAVCTHLGCTPDWLSSANKFKCPCHGSGFDSAGVNFEGPAPKPMLRCKVWLAPDGQLMVDKLVLFEHDEWRDDDSFIA